MKLTAYMQSTLLKKWLSLIKVIHADTIKLLYFSMTILVVPQQKRIFLMLIKCHNKNWRSGIEIYP